MRRLLAVLALPLLLLAPTAPAAHADPPPPAQTFLLYPVPVPDTAKPGNCLVSIEWVPLGVPVDHYLYAFSKEPAPDGSLVIGKTLTASTRPQVTASVPEGQPVTITLKAVFPDQSSSGTGDFSYDNHRC
jgi:hypothetical protein